jgi:hypothetical protein
LPRLDEGPVPQLARGLAPRGDQPHAP